MNDTNSATIDDVSWYLEYGDVADEGDGHPVAGSSSVFVNIPPRAA